MQQEPRRPMHFRPIPPLTRQQRARLVALLAIALERSLLAQAAATPDLAIPPELCVYTDDAPSPEDADA